MTAKDSLSQKLRFGTRFRETVITTPVWTQNDAKRNVMQKTMENTAFCTEKYRLGARFRETVITNPVLTRNDSKTHFEPKT